MADNIYQKLVNVRKEVTGLAKDSTTKSSGQFKYVSSNNILSNLRPLMDEQGLLLECRILSHNLLDKWRGAAGQNEHLTELTVEFVWVNSDNPEEKIVCPWYGQGLDTGEKGVGKALTYAEKYFLLKFFNIPTDEDDPDAAQVDHKRNGNGQVQSPSSSTTRANSKPTNGAQASRPVYPTPDAVVDGETFYGAMAALGCKEKTSIDRAKDKAGYGEHEIDQLTVEDLKRIYEFARGVAEENDRKKSAGKAA